MLTIFCRAALIGLAVLLAVIGGPASAPVVIGKVTTADGQPLPRVKVYGSDTYRVPKAEIRTNRSGFFRLVDPGPVLYFRHPGYGPVSIVVGEKSAGLKVVMEESAKTNWAIPVCSGEKEEGSRVGYRFKFLLPEGATVGKSKDIDYTRYVVSYGNPEHVLVIWFGGNAVGFEAREKTLVNSVSFSERYVELSGFGAVGIDSQGGLPTGNRWRSIGCSEDAFAGEGKSFMEKEIFWDFPRQSGALAEFEDVSPQEAAYFNQIINSVCVEGTAH